MTLEFTDKTARGSGGCNGYGGDYRLNGSTITFAPIASTLMACADVQIMETESAYLAALQDGGTVKADQGTLVITGPNGGTLKFAA